MVGKIKYDKAYFMEGKDSNYINYPEQVTTKTIVVANDLDREFDLKRKHVLDYGCAMGILVRELRLRGVNAFGTDISDYAISEGKKMSYYSNIWCLDDFIDISFLKYYNRDMLTWLWDYVLFLDVLEHIEENELRDLLKLVKTKKIIVKIPICNKEGEDFVFEASRKDKTHVTKHTKRWWKKLFKDFGFKKFTPINTTYLFDSEGVLCGVFE